jgi:hypothetical protein
MPVHVHELHPGRREGGIERSGQGLDRFQQGLCILSKGTKKKCRHQQLRSKDVCFHLHWALLVIPHILGGTDKEL